MGRGRSRVLTRVLGSAGVAAGGFAVGGLAMALGLSVLSPQVSDVHVVLQGDQGDQGGDAGAAGGAAARLAAGPTAAPAPGSAVRAPGPGATGTSSPRVTATPRVTTRRATSPSVAVTARPRKPPVVQSSGS